MKMKGINFKNALRSSLATDTAELEYLRKISERNTAKILALDTNSIALRHELEHKRRGFALLAELSVSLRRRAGYESVFVPVARRINAALNMQRTAVLTPDGKGGFRATVLQGYPKDKMELIASRSIEVDAELLDPEQPVLVTGADPAGRLAKFREAIDIPYIVSSPAFLHGDSVAAILITGRMVEATPFLCRLGRNDVETVQAISALLAAVLVERRLEDDLRRARDHAEKSDKAKGEFLANMSHEVRTPMNAILGMARILSESCAGDKQKQNLEHIMHSTRLLLRIFNDIMDFSNLDTGRMSLQIAEFSIRDTAREISGFVEEKAKDKSLSFDVLVEPDVPDVVLGDPVRVEQVLLNLTDNAVKFTQTGRICVRVSKQSSTPGNVQILFEVEDTGIGMSEEQATDIFLPFAQVDASFTRKHGGTGLGLAICQSLADLMRGEIRCESSLGKGSKFSFAVSFELPGENFAKQKERGETQPSKPEGDKIADGYSESFHGMRVLLAEDNEINQLVAVDMLSGMGVDVTVAENGLEALKALDSGVYDLVLMDIQMPEMDGLTATTQIRANPRYRNLPIVALTAHSLPEDREASLKSGMNDHLTKPIEPEQIYSVLMQWSRRSRL